MPADYIPATDTGFNDWITNFAVKIAANPATYGLVAGDATAITAAKNDWVAAYGPTLNPATRTSPAIAQKDAARASGEATCRPFAVQISRSAGVSDGDKADVGVTVPKTTPTPIPAPLTQPTLSLIAALPQQHQLAYRDTSTPTSKSKPFGAIGVQIYRAVGVAPAVDPSQAVYLTTWTKSPNVSRFAANEAGKVATYFARWVTVSGVGGEAQTGPWSSPLSVGII